MRHTECTRKATAILASSSVYSHQHSTAPPDKNCVTTGSIEAEYVALTQAAKNALPLRFLLEQLGFPQIFPILVNAQDIKTYLPTPPLYR
jgi:hypothetical protein